MGHADKTLQEYASALRAFCKWCVDRKYLDENPLTLLAKFDTTPETERRAMTDKEDHPLGPFKDHPHPFIRYPRTRFPIDDHEEWYQDGRYYCIAKDNGDNFTKYGKALLLFESDDGFDWKLSEEHPCSSRVQDSLGRW